MSYERIFSRAVISRISIILLAAVLTIGMLASCSWAGGDSKKERAETALKIMVAMSEGDQDTLVSLSTGTLARQNADSEYDEPESDVKVTGKKWDGKKLTATITSTTDGVEDVIDVTITPKDDSDNVEVRATGSSVEGTEAELIVVVLVSKDGEWKAKDYLIGGTESWVEAIEESEKKPGRAADEWMNEEDTRPASVCKRNQAAIESAFMEKIGGGEAGIDLSSYSGGSVQDLVSGPAAIVPDPLAAMPHCPTEKADYSYQLRVMEEKGTFITITCSNSEHLR